MAIFQVKGKKKQGTVPSIVKAAGVPIIDLGKIQDRGGREKIVEEVRNATLTWGVFQVVNHGIPLNILEEMLQGCERFHEANQLDRVIEGRVVPDLSKKVRLKPGFSTTSRRKLKDTLVVDIAPEPPAPEEIPSLCRDILFEYVKHVMRLGESLFEIISEMLGLTSDRLKVAKCTEEMIVACHHYNPAPDDTQPVIANVSHCDPSFLTVLLQDQVGGLQFLHQGTWVDVLPLHGALLINIGVLLQLVTNDQIKSVPHRVLIRRKTTRTSVACLYGSPSSKSLHSPLEEFIQTKGHAVYKSITTKEYLVYILTKLTDFTAGLQGFKL
ncbi:hypothetical protein H6P81_017338 [Aristolochia fimbriata]|uniref:Fe2OG dioxygenase domain-containing protein n=1 Tax=Aristolochia fimbriata TaxID=158543 RepID=A0AAV7DYD0_ARIFI|nr:hypothetical protein H6P81_017338 [Aristolochia fimbriata]